MGGFGSGRHGGSVTAEDSACYVLTASALKAPLRTGSRLSGIIHFGEQRFPMTLLIDVSDPVDAFIELIHSTRDERAPDHTIRDRIRLTWTVPTYGGRRWWFLCPRTYLMTTKLYLPSGGSHFWSPRSPPARIRVPARI